MLLYQFYEEALWLGLVLKIFKNFLCIHSTEATVEHNGERRAAKSQDVSFSLVNNEEQQLF